MPDVGERDRYAPTTLMQRARPLPAKIESELFLPRQFEILAQVLIKSSTLVFYA
jgi:hypothetical protein